jgi:hypothetical protein
MRAVGVLGLCCVAVAAGAAAAAPAESGDAVQRPGRALATCFWEGPISMKRPSTRGFDGRYFNFPEESATYWMSRFSLPAGSKLRLHGHYPHARYISLNSYSDAAPTDTLSDVAIEPDRGSTNPFVAGERRDLRKRSWHVTVLDEPRPAQRAPNTLYARPAATDVGAAIEVFYRVYEPDRATNRFLGGASLPRPRLVLDDGTELSAAETCEAVNHPNREITVDTTPEYQWEAGRSAPPCDPETNPAHQPPHWERLFTYEYAALSVVTDCTAEGRAARQANTPEVEGANYSNRDSAYIFTHLAEEFGPVFVIEGKLPRTPTTRDGRTHMGRGQMRFWSLCTNESRVTAFARDCYADRQVPIDRRRNFTVAISKPETRPANAVKRCGFGWLAWPERGDGVGDSGYGLVILRNMLVDAGFERAIQRVEQAGTEAQVMGPYFPRASYTSVEEFEARGCAAGQPAADR